MNKVSKIAGLILLVFAVALALVVYRFRHTWHDRGKAMDMSKIENVSLVNLIAAPEKYHGKWVRVQGVCNLEFEGNALFLTQDDRKHLVTKNAVWISPDSTSLGAGPVVLTAEFSGRFVLVEGVFDMNDRGHMGLFSGAVTNVTRMMTCMER